MYFHPLLIVWLSPEPEKLHESKVFIGPVPWAEHWTRGMFWIHIDYVRYSFPQYRHTHPQQQACVTHVCCVLWRWLINNNDGVQSNSRYNIWIWLSLLTNPWVTGKDWGREKKGTTEDEMVGWHHQFNGHEFERTPEDSEEQYPSPKCCTPWGHESDVTQQLNNIFMKNLQPQQPSLTTFSAEVVWRCWVPPRVEAPSPFIL